MKIDSENTEIEKDLPIIEGEFSDLTDDDILDLEGDKIDSFHEQQTIVSAKKEDKIALAKTVDRKAKTKQKDSKAWLQYIILPLIFLFTALLGGLRLEMADADFIFLKPPLVCLIFAAILVVLFFRAKLIVLENWFSEDFAPLQNTANAGVLITTFAASTQIFNSLLPEQGLPFWIISFFFFWSLWTNLFAEFDAKKLIRSLGALFGLAFVVKYLIFANLTAPESQSWWQSLTSGNLTKEAFTYLLDLPRFAAGTGYIQFFALIFYLLGLFLLPQKLVESKKGEI